MANIKHGDIVEADGIHEPKGVNTATSGQAYIADGAASGAWEGVQRTGYSCLKCSTTGNTTGITTAYQALNNANVGGTCTWSTNIVSSDITHNTTSGYFTVSEAGIYNINASINFIPAAADTYHFTIGVDSGSGIVEKSSSIISSSTITGSAVGDTRNVSFTCIPSLLASDDVYIMVKSTGGNEIDISHLNFVAIRSS